MESSKIKFYDHPSNIGAKFSEDGKHRLVLWRSWDVSMPMAMCIGLNPSTANSVSNDATINRLVHKSGLLHSNGFGGIYMLNLYTFITPYPSQLADLHETPFELFDYYAFSSEKIIFCWGNFKQADQVSEKVIKHFPNAYCFGKNKNGSPKHPLYLPARTSLIKF